MRKLSLAALAVVTAASAASPVAAATVTTNLGVKIVIQASCTVSAPAAGLDFGTAGVLTANIDQSANLTVQCTNTLPYRILLGAGAGTGATVTTRNMTGTAGAIVNYALYRDSTRALNWGETIGTDAFTGTGNGAAQSIPVYGRVPAQTTPAAGTYTDTVLVTVDY